MATTSKQVFIFTFVKINIMKLFNIIFNTATHKTTLTIQPPFTWFGSHINQIHVFLPQHAKYYQCVRVFLNHITILLIITSFYTTTKACFPWNNFTFLSIYFANTAIYLSASCDKFNKHKSDKFYTRLLIFSAFRPQH